MVELALKASPPFSRILVAVDRSENSNRALEYTLKLAKLHESKVKLRGMELFQYQSSILAR